MKDLEHIVIIKPNEPRCSCFKDLDFLFQLPWVEPAHPGWVLGKNVESKCRFPTSQVSTQMEVSIVIGLPPVIIHLWDFP